MPVVAWKMVLEQAARSHGVVSTHQLYAAGLSHGAISRLVEAGRLVDMGTGAWLVGGAPLTQEAQILGAIRGLEGDVWASHRTAAWLHQIPVYGPAGLIEVTRMYGASANRGSLIVHRSTRAPAHHLTVVRGIPVSSVPRTMFDLARLTGPRVLDRAVEEVLRARLCTIGALHQVLAELGGRGRPGTVKFRTVVEGRGRGYIPTSSELTAVGRAVLASIPGIEWEVRMSDEQGYVRQVDGCIRSARVVVEFDGSQFHDQPSDRAHDEATDARLEAAGYVVERLRWGALTGHPEACIAKVLRLVRGSTAEL